MAQSRPHLRIGLAGLGAATPNALPEIANHPDYRITAGADLRPEALARFATEVGGETYESVEAMCHSPNVDVIHILTPNHLHAQHAIAAANAGKQVICDKPMAISLAECDAMIAAAELNGVRLLIGHTQSLDPPIRRMAEIVASGELGAVTMVNTWFFSDWLYRPRSGYELDVTKGEGLVMRQGPVQVDIARMLGGGLVKSVRAIASSVDPKRPIDGSYSAFLEFETSAAATLVYNALGHFDSSELTFGIGLQGNPADPATHVRSHRHIADFGSAEQEQAYKDSTRYGGSRAQRPLTGPPSNPNHAFFGLTIASCERGDVRQSPDGLFVYDRNGPREIAIPAPAKRYTTTELDLMYDAWWRDRPLASHDGRWGKATVEVCLGMLESSRAGQAVAMQHQTAYHS
ncbi:MAG TPA: Gfo/Idh/MocA family oxidoreductase [Chloroflexota bacterium]|nr:Gfo/Idh/MocA family oxidoreductase [Chloroflexota bacterium]